jgi:hypothetical protein
MHVLQTVSFNPNARIGAIAALEDMQRSAIAQLVMIKRTVAGLPQPQSTDHRQYG